jgi:hypothetical protein
LKKFLKIKMKLVETNTLILFQDIKKSGVKSKLLSKILYFTLLKLFFNFRNF